MYNQTNEFDITFHFKRPNIIIVYLVSVLLILIIGITDYISGFEMSFSIFYLIPISFSTFMGNIRIGLFISLLSAITWYQYGNSCLECGDAFRIFCNPYNFSGKIAGFV